MIIVEEDNNSNKLVWILISIIAIIIDVGIIIYATYVKNSVLLYLMILAGLVGAYLNLNYFNKDERTDTAINDASRDTITIFILLFSIIGILFVIVGSLNDSILWEIGATLIVSVLVIIYLLVIISVYHENRMS